MSLSANAIRKLRGVKRRIMNEPRRMSMGMFLISKEHPDWIGSPARGYPQCGTVGCIAGWVVAASIPDALKIASTRGDGWVEDKAKELLRLDWDQADELFRDDALVHDPKPQTVAHAKKVCAHIDRFIAKYRGGRAGVPA